MSSDGVYVIYHPDGYAKIGKAKDHKKRFKSIQRGSPYELEYWRQVSTLYSGDRIETKIHKRLFEYHSRGEWFEISKSELLDVLESVADDEENILNLHEPLHNPEKVVPNSVKPKGYKLQQEAEKFKEEHGL